MKNIVKQLLVLVLYFLFWVIYFVFNRIFFLAYNFDQATEIGFKNSFYTFIYGVQLDISFSAYLCVLPFLIFTFQKFLPTNTINKVINYYTITVLLLLSFLMIIDAGLYKPWGIRIDNTLLNYLNTPKLMLASVSTTQLISGILFWLLFSILFIKLYKKTFKDLIPLFNDKNLLKIPVFIVVFGSLIIPIRGGFQTIPVNQSNVYFSEMMFANHAAVNSSWNFFNSIKRANDGTNPYKFFDNKIAEKISNNERNNLLESNYDSILNIDKPNIILIVWESLSAKIVGSLNGEKQVTPNLNKLSEEGILFTNFYSNGDRTDKGIPAVMSGYLPQPAVKIMRIPNKTRSLPMLSKEMQKIGYETSFYYGGNLSFGNMNTYLRNAGINNIVDGSSFDKKDWNSKWGAYDDVFMDRFAKDFKTNNKKPFFKIALTLSSHEPFEIKGDYKFGKDSEANLYRSSHYYTDKVIGDFVSFAKKQDWYKNTLIVIMSDHGHSYPTRDKPYFSTKKFHIPMLWIGGALNKKEIKIENISSQVDFSYTLLDLLGGNKDIFTFSKNIFNNSANQYAHYIFNKGFGTHTKDGTYIYDYVSKKPIQKLGKTSHLDSLGKALTQISYQDFLER